MAQVADPCGGPGECGGLGRSDVPLVFCACQRMVADNVLQVKCFWLVARVLSCATGIGEYSGEASSSEQKRG